MLTLLMKISFRGRLSKWTTTILTRVEGPRKVCMLDLIDQLDISLPLECCSYQCVLRAMSQQMMNSKFVELG